MSEIFAIQSPELEAQGVTHGFFTRQGGVSTGVYHSLNGGVGSNDHPQAVAENRRRMAAHLNVASGNLMVPYQTHSPDILIIDSPFAERPRCDGLVTATRGLALGVTGADCGIILLVEAEAAVIGAVHAGWKGAFTGVLEAVLAQMEVLGAERQKVRAVLGPTIGPNSYEVGPEFVERFSKASNTYKDFFKPSPRAGHAFFDLPGFIGLRLRSAGVETFTDLALDTYPDEERFFSYRRCTHRKERDYGRQIAAIALPSL